MQKNRTGFTLIELVIVVTIIVILSGISGFSMVGYIANSRDTKRIIDLQSIAVNLDISNKKNGFLYPVNSYAQDITYLSGGLFQTGGRVGEIHEDELPEINQMPIDPKKKSYYIYGTTPDRKKYEIASRLEKINFGQTIATGIQDSDIFGDNIYIIGNYRQDIANSYNLQGLIALSENTSSGFILPTESINIGTWDGSKIIYDGSGVVLKKSQTTY